jgi:hypothetical protein
MVDQLDRRTIGQCRHLVVRHDAANDASGAVAVAEQVARLDRMLEPSRAGFAEQDRVFKRVRTPADEGGQQIASAPEGEVLGLVTRLRQRRLRIWNR